MWLTKYIVLIVFTQCYHFGELNFLRRNISDIFSFVMQLRNNSDSVHEYVAKIQVIFCPEQPICTDEGVRDSNAILETLQAAVTVADKTIRVEDIKDFVGICCLPCSCSETCTEDDNCCPTKYYTNFKPTQEPVKRECIVANVASYKRKEKADFRIPRYFMTTKCFEVTPNNSLVAKCETPDINIPDDTVPVTSGRTGHTYWNRHCAICNGDTENLDRWTAKLSLGHGKIFYFASRTPSFISKVNSVEHLHAALTVGENIFYTPPVPMDHNRCFERRSYLTCKEHLENETGLFRQQACKQLYNPVFYSGPVLHVYLNIFCFFCSFEQDNMEIAQSDKCSLKDIDVEKFLSKQMSAILDYGSSSKTEPSDKHRHHSLEEKQSLCPCDQFYDHHKMMCRPLLCPVGEVYMGCQCIQPLKNLSGMPVHLKLKITPNSNPLNPLVDIQIHKFHKALKNRLQEYVTNIKVDILLTFIQEKGAMPFYFCLALARTDQGYDTKETFKKLIPFLDTPRYLEFFSMKTKFSVYFLTTISLWFYKDIQYNYFIGAEYLDETEHKRNLTLIFSIEGFVRSDKAYIQFFSPLLYCELVQLNEREFIQEHDKIIINTSSRMKYVRDFYLIPPSKVRICVDQYLDQAEMSITTAKFLSDALFLFCLLAQHFFE